jgi:hypothetical protein
MRVSGVNEVTGDYRNRIPFSKSPPIDIEILAPRRARNQLSPAGFVC